MQLPPYTIFPAIKGNRVSLREIQQADLKGLMEISFYNGIQATTMDEAITMQHKINADYLSGNSIHWCITDNETQNVVGTCGYYRGFKNGAGELGCVLLEKYRGQGFMAAALYLAINFGLHTMGLEKIFAGTTKQNIKAVQLLTKLNFINVDAPDETGIIFEYTSYNNAGVNEIIN